MNNCIIKKEFRECLYDSKGLWMIAAASAVLSGLSFLVVNIKEGSVLAQTDILQYAMKASLFLALIVSMVLGAASFAGEREENTLESLLLTPVSKRSLASAKYFAVLLIGILLTFISLPYLAAISAGSGLLSRAEVMTFSGGFLLLIGFTALSIVFSILIYSTKASVLVSVFVLILFVFPAMAPGIFSMSPAGSALLNADPVYSWFTMMGKYLTEKANLSSLVGYFIPILVFAAVSIVLLAVSSRKISLKGEK